MSNHIFHNGCWYERDGSARPQAVEVVVNFPSPEELEQKAPQALKASDPDGWMAKTKNWVVTRLFGMDRPPMA